MDNVQTWSLIGFLDELKRIKEHMPDRRFIFILGAGASIQSGVKAAGALANEWMEIIHRRETDVPDFKTWLQNNPLQIKEWDANNLASFYPSIFEYCFAGDHEAGYAALEKAIESSKPSFGYAVLAWIMTNTTNNMVITTNFDNLVADSLYLYGRRTPHVIGHESLAGYLKPLGGRPMVAKIHRDLFTDPINDTNGTSKLKAPWDGALKSVFKFYTPIFIGYGGNDGSLMNFLSDLLPTDISGRPFWCYYEPAGRPNGAIKTLLEKHSGVLVPTQDWDTLMLAIGNAWGYQHQAQIDGLDKHIELMKETLQQQIQKTSLEGNASVREKLKPLPKKDKDKTWLDWVLEAQSNGNPDGAMEIYRKAITALPNSYQLHNNYANLLINNGLADEAEKHYKIALELDPNQPIIQNGYANLLTELDRTTEAKTHFEKSLELNPDYALAHNNYAALLSGEGHIAEAEEHYKKAIELNPNEADYHFNYAELLADSGRTTEADEHYKEAIELNPSDAEVYINYAKLLQNIERKAEAEEHYKKAIELNPDYALAHSNYAKLLSSESRIPEAKVHYKKAIELDKNNPDYNSDYIHWLNDIGLSDEDDKN